jgi:hypothetical protein
MATNQLQTNSKLRHISTFISSGTFTPPPNCNIVYVAIQGSSGGGATGGNTRYGSYQGPQGGNGVWYAGYVQVAPGVACSVVVGAAGPGSGSYSSNAAGGNGGTSSFDGAIIVIGGNGGNNSPSASGSGQTSLPTLNPGSSTLIRVTSTSSSYSNVTIGGSGGGGNNPGSQGQQAKIYIFAY